MLALFETLLTTRTGRVILDKNKIKGKPVFCTGTNAMRTLSSFSELYRTDFNITSLYAERQKWTPDALFRMNHPRAATGILLLHSATGRYFSQDGLSFFAPQGSVICLPEGAKYNVLNLRADLAFPDAYLIEFRTFCDKESLSFGTSPFLVPDVNFFLLTEIAEKIVRDYEAPLRSPCALRSDIYALLSAMGESSMRIFNRRFSSIEKGIELIRKNPKSALSVESIASMCHVSSAYFRKLFKEYSGESPCAYRASLIIDEAKQLLRDGNLSISRAAEILGFENEAYFSRFFKKKVGISPRAFREQYAALRAFSDTES